MRYVLFYCGAETELYHGWTKGETWNGWDVIYVDARTTRELLTNGNQEFYEDNTMAGLEFVLETAEIVLIPNETGPDGTGLYCLDGFCCQIPGKED